MSTSNSDQPAERNNTTPHPTSPDAIRALSALQLRDFLADGTLSASQVTEAFIEKIVAENPRLGSFMYTDFDAARTRAAELDEAFKTTGPVGPLHGLPQAFKDTVNVKGMPTTFGSPVFDRSEPAEYDDAAAESFHTAGAIQIGKTTLPEFALPPHSENFISAPARNPLDDTRTPGGSSGGAAAAVAARMLPVAPGTDGGGSIRIPASATGLVGFKPGRTTVPTDPQDEGVKNLGVSGPIAHSVADAALLLDAMVDPTQFHGSYLQAARKGANSTEQDHRESLRIGYTTASPFAPDLNISLSKHAVTALTQATIMLASDGHEVDQLDLSYLPNYHTMFQTVWTSGLANIPLPEDTDARVGPLAQHFIETSAARTEEETATAVAGLTEWANDTREQFGTVDVVLTPVLAFAPPKLGRFLSLPPQEDYEFQCCFTPYTSMINVMGLPAISIPILTDDDGLSWSIQAVGRPGAEAQLFELGARLETLVATSVEQAESAESPESLESEESTGSAE